MFTSAADVFGNFWDEATMRVADLDRLAARGKMGRGRARCEEASDEKTHQRISKHGASFSERKFRKRGTLPAANGCVTRTFNSVREKYKKM